MKKHLCVLAMLVLACGAAAQSKPAGFERLKSLAGEWEGKAPDGKTGRVTYQVVSNGSAVLETIFGDEHAEGMITVYHPDGDSILATHYCAVGNQPRMRAKPSGGNTLSFQLADVTNRGASKILMQGLVVRFEDANHFVQDWTSEENGKKETASFRWTRKK